MSNKFNLGGYLKNLIFSAKNKDEGQQIETKLTEKNKKEEEPQETTEKLLQKDREDTNETITEKQLEKVRAGSTEMLVEGQLNKSKSTIMKHRNAETAKGNINKLEEKRLKSDDRMELEKQEPASEMDKPRRFYEIKSPDGLKLAQSIKIAKAINFDIDDVDTLERDDINVDEGIDHFAPPVLQEELSPEALKELSNLENMEEEQGEEEKQKMTEDILNDPDMLSDVFTEEVVGQDNSTGTMIEERKISFNLKDPDGEIKGVFKKGNGIDKNTLKKAIMNFINLNHVEDIVEEDAIQIDLDRFSLEGSATYMVPVA